MSMDLPQAHLRRRTPQACERCRRSKTKCTGDRPQCRSCMKRKVTCSWAQTIASDTFHALTPPEDLQPSRRVENSTPRSHAIVPGTFSMTATSLLFPEPRKVQRLFDIFFARHHEAELCSFFHKPSLDIQTLHERSPLLVNSVISLAALYISKDEAESDFGFHTPSALSDHHAGLAKIEAFRLCDEPSIETIQTYLILSLRELLIWKSVKAYMYTGTAFRMAQVLHLNVEARQGYSLRQKEIRRRTFWACFVMDRLISYSCNKPFTVSLKSAQTNLPCPENFFVFDEVCPGILVTELPLHSNKISHLGIMPFFISVVQIWADMALLHVSGGRRRSKYGPDDSKGDFYQCRNAIENLSASMPPLLSWSVQNYKLHQTTGQAQIYVNLCFLLHHSKCVMHQEYLPQLDSQYSLSPEADYVTSTYDAAGISLDYIDDTIIKPCMFSINTITEMALTLNAGSDKDRELLQSTFAANSVLTAAAVHLWVLYTQTCYECPKDEALAKAETLRQIIKSWQPQWVVATAWVETLEMLYKLYVYSYGKIIESDLDCWDVGTDDINDSPAPPEEVIDESANRSEATDDPTIISQRLYDKVRSILVNPLLSTDLKKRNLRAYSRTLWQHMWTLGPTDEGIGDDLMSLETLMGEPGSMLFGMPPHQPSPIS